MQLCTGLSFDSSSNQFFFRKENIPFNDKYLRATEFTSIEAARSRFLSKELGHMKELEARFITYSESVEHDNAGVLSREARKAVIGEKGYDCWYRVGSIFPSGDIIGVNSIPLACIDHSPADSASRFVLELYKLNERLKAYISQFNCQVHTVKKFKSSFLKVASAIVARGYKYGLQLRSHPDRSQARVDPFSEYVSRYFDIDTLASSSETHSLSWLNDGDTQSLNAMLLNKSFFSKNAGALDIQFYDPFLDEPYQRAPKRKHVTESNITPRAAEIMKEIEEEIRKQELEEEFAKMNSGVYTNKITATIGYDTKRGDEVVSKCHARLDGILHRRSILIRNMDTMMEKITKLKEETKSTTNSSAVSPLDEGKRFSTAARLASRESEKSDMAPSESEAYKVLRDKNQKQNKDDEESSEKGLRQEDPFPDQTVGPDGSKQHSVDTTEMNQSRDQESIHGLIVSVEKPALDRASTPISSPLETVLLAPKPESSRSSSKSSRKGSAKTPSAQVEELMKMALFF